MAPDRTVVLSAVRSAPLPPEAREKHETRPAFVSPAPASPPARTAREERLRLRRRPPRLRGQRLRGRGGDYRFVDVATGGVMGWLGTKHRLVPVEAIAEGEPGSITLNVDRQTLDSAPTLGNPHEAPDEDLQRAAREHCE